VCINPIRLILGVGGSVPNQVGYWPTIAKVRYSEGLPLGLWLVGFGFGVIRVRVSRSRVSRVKAGLCLGLELVEVQKSRSQ